MSAVIDDEPVATTKAGDRPARPPLREPAPASNLRMLAGRSAVDLPAAREAVADLLTALGHDPCSDHLLDTPRRVADALAELLTPVPFAFTTFPNEEAYDGLVLVRDVAFTSLCEHHLLPFSGVAHIGYLPDERIVGLSKLARTVAETFARQLQVQERLTADRRLAAGPASASRRRRRTGSRTPVHDTAGSSGHGIPHRHVGHARWAARRRTQS